MRQFVFLTSSPRPNGNSTQLAKAAAKPLPPDHVQWVNLATPALPAFTDPRPGLCTAPSGHLARVLAGMLPATDLVIAAPIYWYAFPSPLHLLLSHMSNWLDNPALGFADAIRGKTVWLVTARADPAPDVPMAAEALLRRSFTWMGASWGGALHGIANAPGEITADPSWQAASDFLT